MNSLTLPERIFTRSEFGDRIARLRDAMRERGVDLMLIDDSEILTYFVGFETSLNRYRACIVPLEGTPTMVLRALDVTPFREQAWFSDAVGIEDAGSIELAVADAIRARGHAASRIGVDLRSHAMTVKSYEEIRAALPDAVFVAMTHVPWELRLVKSDAEIARIAEAARIADGAMRAIAGWAKVGATTRQATALAATQFVTLGGDAGYVGRIAAGKGWDFLHSGVSDVPLEHGDLLHVELAPSFAGYSARLMRCIAIGPLDEVRAEAAERLAALQDDQFEAMRPGAVAAEVDGILRQGILREGLRESYANITGYTLGYYSNQPLRSSDFTRTFHPHAEWRIETGMAFHMYTSAGGVSLSETLVITQDGARRLTTTPRRLLSAGPS